MNYWKVVAPGRPVPWSERGVLAIRAATHWSYWAKEDRRTLAILDYWGNPSGPPYPIDRTVLRTLRSKFGAAVKAGKAELGPGEHHPRIWRPGYSPEPDTNYVRKSTFSVQAARNLFVDMRDLFRCIEPSKANSAAYGHRIRELLMLACTEVESGCKSVLLENGYPPNDRMTTRDYVKVRVPLRLKEWELSLAMHRDFPSFKPFGTWSALKPTDSLDWYRRYNSVKHGRETAFAEGTLKGLVHALGAVFVIVSAQFGLWPRAGDDEAERNDDEVSKPTWADDFAIVARPRWALGEFYVPPKFGGVANWTAKPYRW